MKNPILLSAILSLSVAIPASADPARAPKAVEVLTNARSAATSLRSISYHAQYEGTGTLASLVSVIDGQVSAERGPNDDSHKLFIEGTKVSPKASNNTTFRFASDGRFATSVHDEVKLCFTGKAAEGRTRERSALFPPNYLDSSAYQMELNAAVIEYQGIRDINGTPCHVIVMTYDEATRSKATLYIGKDDYILRRKETPVMVSANANLRRPNGAFVFTARDFKLNPTLEADTFRLSPPPGYKKSDFQMVSQSRKQRQAGQGIQATRIRQRPNSPQVGSPQVGNPAPEWTLKDTNGKNVSLKDLRGKVVVLDFWASWCGPCRRAMPGMQKLHERFKGKPVAIYGVNCREKKRDFDPAEFMKKQGFSYPQLTNGNIAANAYRVRGIPAFFVIGKDGKIVHAGKGFSPQMESQMGNIIERALK